MPYYLLSKIQELLTPFSLMHNKPDGFWIGLWGINSHHSYGKRSSSDFLLAGYNLSQSDLLLNAKMKLLHLKHSNFGLFMACLPSQKTLRTKLPPICTKEKVKK